MTSSVLKFGGTSVGSLERIEKVADIVAARYLAGEKLAVVVSAMAGQTDDLVKLTKGVVGDGFNTPEFRNEYDVIVSSGEQVSSGLLALTLCRRGLKARSWLGWQLAMKTTTQSPARITGFEGNDFPNAVKSGEIAIVAGFQGVTTNNRISTLGRGGSDTSAVAVAAALGTNSCDIYTDVDGVYTTDPRIVSKATRISRISYEEMLEMASLGAKVLQTRSVELAMNHGVRIRVLSSFDERNTGETGTIVCSEDEIVEKQVVVGVVYSRDEAKITLYGVLDKPGVSARIFSLLAAADVNVDMIVQASARGPAVTNMVFTCPNTQSRLAEQTLEKSQEQIGFERLEIDTDIAKVSIVGVGMKSHTGVAETMFSALHEKNINIDVISTSEVKISVLIESAYTELAVRALHTAFNLDAD